jgi:hypothetical protein
MSELNNLPARALYAAMGGTQDEQSAVVYVYDLAPDRDPKNVRA